jgi:hypothetical protein
MRLVKAHKGREEVKGKWGEEQRERVNSRFSGLYLAYKTDNSVNIPYSSASEPVHGVKA